ncbi:hypothetical protein ACT4MK_01805 (plasmid) [Bradyrhizobium barranii]|uniref:hypothetical protein n=1 Tax=Bradyrhizobium TaxID=374 RepID=UPI003F239AE1
MKPGVTTEFETTEFAGIAAKIINPFPSPFTVIDMTIKPGFGAPAHISSTEDKLFMVIEGQKRQPLGNKSGSKRLFPVRSEVWAGIWAMKQAVSESAEQ